MKGHLLAGNPEHRALPSSGDAHSGTIGALPDPSLEGESENLKKTGTDVAQAKKQLQHIKNRVGTLTDHLIRMEKIAHGEGEKRYLKWLADEAETIERIPKELKGHLEVFNRSIAKLIEDDSLSMKIVERTTFAYGRLIGELTKKRDAGHLTNKDFTTISGNIRDRGERIIKVTKNLHLFVNWLKQSDDDFKQEFVKLEESVPRLAQFIKTWHAWREENPTIDAMRAHTGDEKIRDAIGQYLAAMRKALENIVVIEKALAEYARFVKETNALVAQDKAFFDGLAGKKGAERLAHFRKA